MRRWLLILIALPLLGGSPNLDGVQVDGVVIGGVSAGGGTDLTTGAEHCYLLANTNSNDECGATNLTANGSVSYATDTGINYVLLDAASECLGSDLGFPGTRTVNQTFSLCAFVYTNTLCTETCTEHIAGEDNDYGIRSLNTGTNIEAFLGGQDADSTVANTTGTWRAICAVYTSGTDQMHVWINGQDKGNVTDTDNVVDSGDRFSIGAHDCRDSSDRQFLGRVGQVVLNVGTAFTSNNICSFCRFGACKGGSCLSDRGDGACNSCTP